MIVAVTRDQPPLPSTKNPAVGAALEALVMRCLEKDPAARPTMASLAASLARPALLEPGAAAASSGERVSPIRSRSLLYVLFAAVLAGGVVLYASPRRAVRVEADGGAVADAAPVATAITDLPLPASTVPAALEMYKKATADEHGGNMDAAGDDLEAATQLDPTLAAAHLRLALLRATTAADPARTHFALAVKHRDRLSERDLALLEAAQRLFQSEPPDVKGFGERLDLLVQRYPGDTELLYELATYRDILGEFAAAEALEQRAVSLDPKFGLAWAEIAEIQAYRGKFDESLATVKQCLEVTPEASWCIWVSEFIHGARGECELNEANARRRIAIDPNIHDGYKSLLYTSIALRKPEPLLLEALDQTVQRIPDEFGKKRFRLNMSIRIASIKGDFVTASKLTAELRALVATRTDAADHAAATLISAEIEREAGRPDRAAEIAKAFVQRRDVWQAEPIVHDYSMAGDLTPLILTFVHDPKYLPVAEYQAALDGWRKRNDAGAYGDYRPYIWVYGYAAAVVTADDAKLALEALPRYSPIPPFLPNGALPALSVGRALWLGGKEEEGLAYLARAAGQCDLGTRPMQIITSHAWYAEALEKKGDKAGACRELGTLLSFWGNAKPRSVTADWAKARSRALACTDAPR